MPTPVLPGYTWNIDSSRYHNTQSGRFVSRDEINNLLRTEIQSAESRFRDLATAFHEKRISPTSFVEQMRTEQRRLTLQQISLGKGGFNQLSFSDYGRAGASLRDTYSKITGTAQDVVDGKISLSQLLNRVDGYAGEARGLYYKTTRGNVPVTPDGMISIERRTLGDSQHCEDCLRYYEMGWQVAGTVLPVPSVDCQCGSHCRCGLERRDVPADELDSWLGTKR